MLRYIQELSKLGARLLDLSNGYFCWFTGFYLCFIYCTKQELYRVLEMSDFSILSTSHKRTHKQDEHVCYISI